MAELKAGGAVLGKALFIASVAVTAVAVTQCFGDQPFLGDTAACVQFQLTDFYTFGFMSLAQYADDELC